MQLPQVAQEFNRTQAKQRRTSDIRLPARDVVHLVRESRRRDDENSKKFILSKPLATLPGFNRVLGQGVRSCTPGGGRRRYESSRILLEASGMVNPPPICFSTYLPIHSPFIHRIAVPCIHSGISHPLGRVFLFHSDRRA